MLECHRLFTNNSMRTSDLRQSTRIEIHSTQHFSTIIMVVGDITTAGLLSIKMLHQVYPLLFDLKKPIQQHIEATCHRLEQDYMNYQNQNEFVGICEQRSPVMANTRASRPIVTSSSTSTTSKNEAYFTADEISDDDSWWYSDAKTPESRYDDWYYLVYLPSMEKQGLYSRPSSRRRYRGMFNPSNAGEVVNSELVEESIGTGRGGDQNQNASSYHSLPDDKPCCKSTSTKSFSPQLTPRDQELEDVEWGNFESHGSVCSTSPEPEVSPRSVELEWDDFGEEVEQKPTTRDAEVQWDPEEQQQAQSEPQIINEYVREANPLMSQNENPETQEFQVEKQGFVNGTQTEENEIAVEEAPGPEILSPREYYTPRNPFSPRTETNTTDVIEITPESYCPLPFSTTSPPASTQSQPEPECECEVGELSSGRSWTDVLKSEMKEWSRSWSESQYNDMPWVHSKFQALSFSSDNSQDHDTETETEAKKGPAKGYSQQHGRDKLFLEIVSSKIKSESVTSLQKDNQVNQIQAASATGGTMGSSFIESDAMNKAQIPKPQIPQQSKNSNQMQSKTKAKTSVKRKTKNADKLKVQLQSQKNNASKLYSKTSNHLGQNRARRSKQKLAEAEQILDEVFDALPRDLTANPLEQLHSVETSPSFQRLPHMILDMAPNRTGHLDERSLTTTLPQYFSALDLSAPETTRPPQMPSTRGSPYCQRRTLNSNSQNEPSALVSAAACTVLSPPTSTIMASNDLNKTKIPVPVPTNGNRQRGRGRYNFTLPSQFRTPNEDEI